MTFIRCAQPCNHWRLDDTCHSKQLDEEDFVEEALRGDLMQYILINLQEINNDSYIQEVSNEEDN